MIVVGCNKPVVSNYLLVGPETIGGMLPVGVFLRDPNPYLREFQRKPWKNSELLGRQERPRIEPSTSRLPVQRTAPPLAFA